MSGRITVPMAVYTAEVVATEDLSPTLRRVVLGGQGLAGYRTTGVGDEYIRLLFPAEGTTDPVLPTITDGNLDYGSIDLNLLRTYTVRRFDADRGQVTVDFVVHGHGVATTWARRAIPGDLVGLNSPTGLYDPPADLAWQVLVADLAGLPALARLLEQTPEGVRTRVVVEVPGPEDHIVLPQRANTTISWVHGGNGSASSRLEEIVRTLPRPDGTGYVWVAGETAALRAVRRHLRRELKLPPDRFKVIGYWTDAAESWQERYDALDEATRAELEDMWDDDSRDEDEIQDEYDERLTALGL